MSKTRLMAVIGFMAFLLGGCAFGTRRPLLEYRAVTANSQPKNITIYVERFKDERTEKNVIGHVRNGWGLKTADVVTDTDISQWVTDALKAELGNGGYIVAKDRTKLTAEGEVITVYCDSFMQYEGTVTLGIVLKRNGEVLIDKKYNGKATNLNWAATSQGYGKTVEQSLQNVMKQILSDINQILPGVPANISDAVAPAIQAAAVELGTTDSQKTQKLYALDELLRQKRVTPEEYEQRKRLLV